MLDVLQNNFFIFSDKIEDKNHFILLIMNEDSEKINKLYSFPKDMPCHDWDSFKKEIITNNRYFPRTPIYSDIFSKQDGSMVFYQLVENLLTIYGQGDIFYRARISEDILGNKDLGRPPPAKTTDGRANPKGISYLYLASNLDTCIAEVRPSKGAKVCVAKLRPTKELKLLDLTMPRKIASFLLFNDKDLQSALVHMALLEKFSSELSISVLPERSYLDYIPTQFICEFFKAVCGYSGIVFNSSFEHGKNIVLFQEENIEFLEIKQHMISNIVTNANLIEP